jgi:hypothetical protein
MRRPDPHAPPLPAAKSLAASRHSKGGGARRGTGELFCLSTSGDGGGGGGGGGGAFASGGGAAKLCLSVDGKVWSNAVDIDVC